MNTIESARSWTEARGKEIAASRRRLRCPARTRLPTPCLIVVACASAFLTMAELARLAITTASTVIWTEKDSDGSKISVCIPK